MWQLCWNSPEAAPVGVGIDGNYFGIGPDVSTIASVWVRKANSAVSALCQEFGRLHDRFDLWQKAAETLEVLLLNTEPY